MSDFINQYPYSDYHNLNLDWIIKITKAVEAETARLSEEFAKIEVMTEDYIQSMIDHAIATNNIDLYNRMTLLKTEITSEYQAYINSQITSLKTYLDNQDVYYDDLSKSYAINALDEAKTYTDLHVLDYTLMINPITGEYEDVRKVVTDVVTYFHSENTLTASEYDSLDLTAQAYDNHNLSAFDYDFNGKLLLT